jgi:hypothetical protein
VSHTNFVQRGRLVTISLLIASVPLAAQVDQQRAAAYFEEAKALCEREGGKLWGVSLCGPMVLYDAPTRTIATNQPAPPATRPQVLGFANSALDWGGARWSTFVWSMLPDKDAHARARLMMHELFHRIQPQAGFAIRDGDNSHLDTLDGRYWMQLEWRALAKALASAGGPQKAAARDALAFRAKRRAVFPGAAENERLLEINEGLAQYTGTVVASATAAEAVADAIEQLNRAALPESFVRTFAYPSGAAYGLLLDNWSPGWTRRIKNAGDIGQLAATAGGLTPAEDVEAAARLYGAADLRASETKRDVEHKARVAELRRRFVEGPVLTLPNGRTNSFTTAGITPISGAGTIYPSYRTSGDWGSVEAGQILVSSDHSNLTLPGPVKVDGAAVSGAGWTIQLGAGWTVRPGKREGDLEIVKSQ